MEKWPLMNKNKVEDSQVYIPVGSFIKFEDGKIKLLAQKVWGIEPCRTYRWCWAFCSSYLITGIPYPLTTGYLNA